jgi:hypothetical protein
MTRTEEEALDEFLDEQLAKGSVAVAQATCFF